MKILSREFLTELRVYARLSIWLLNAIIPILETYIHVWPAIIHMDALHSPLDFNSFDVLMKREKG